jgi:hypothetical protein
MFRARRSFRAASPVPDASALAADPVRRLGPDHAARLAGLRASERRIALVARVLDDLVRIPGTRYRVGVEPVIGLIPGIGDLIGAVLGAWIVLEARRFGLPAVVVARMVANVVIDLVVGLVPVLGDLFDLAYKSNARNLALLRRHAIDPGADTSGDRSFLLGLGMLLLGVAWLAMILLEQLLNAVAGTL